MSNLSMALLIVVVQLASVLIAMIFLHQRLWRRFEPHVPVSVESETQAGLEGSELADRLIQLNQSIGALRERWKDDLPKQEAIARMEQSCDFILQGIRGIGESYCHSRQVLSLDPHRLTLDHEVYSPLIVLLEQAQRHLEQGLEHQLTALVHAAESAEPIEKNIQEGGRGGSAMSSEADEPGIDLEDSSFTSESIPAQAGSEFVSSDDQPEQIHSLSQTEVVPSVESEEPVQPSPGMDLPEHDELSGVLDELMESAPYTPTQDNGAQVPLNPAPPRHHGSEKLTNESIDDLLQEIESRAK